MTIKSPPMRARFETLDYADDPSASLLLVRRRPPVPIDLAKNGLAPPTSLEERMRVPRMSSLVRFEREHGRRLARTRRRFFVALSAVFVIGVGAGVVLGSLLPDGRLGAPATTNTIHSWKEGVAYSPPNGRARAHREREAGKGASGPSSDRPLGLEGAWPPSRNSSAKNVPTRIAAAGEVFAPVIATVAMTFGAIKGAAWMFGSEETLAAAVYVAKLGITGVEATATSCSTAITGR